MIKFSGYEASVLSFVAMFPASEEAKSKAATLGSEAHKIADAIINGRGDAHALEAAAAIRRWADGAARSAEMRKRRKS